VPDLDFTVSGVIGHAAQAALWYPVDMWSGTENASFEVKIVEDTGNRRLLASLFGASQVMAAAVDAAPPSLRGFHPFGSPDPSGFAARSSGEMRGWPRASWPGSSRGTPSVRARIRGRYCSGPTGGCRWPVVRTRSGGAGTAPRWPSGTGRRRRARPADRSGLSAPTPISRPLVKHPQQCACRQFGSPHVGVVDKSPGGSASAAFERKDSNP
jgi:hypothetical protein